LNLTENRLGPGSGGYDIPFNRHFYVFKPPRELADTDAELKGVTDSILTMIGGLSK
jgi:type I restriction enzyme M protein